MGFVVSKAVGSAVDRHRVSRRLRHIVRNLLADLEPTDRLVVRALPASRTAPFSRLDHEVRDGMRRVRAGMGRRR